MSKPRDWSVYACWVKGRAASEYLMVRPVDGVIAPGRRVLIQASAGRPPRADGWQKARVVESWEHGLGSIVCLEMEPWA